MGTIFFEGKDREMHDNIRLPDGHRLLILTYPGEPALAVTAIQFEYSGLFTDMDCVFHIKNMERFYAKLPDFIENGVF